MPKSGRKPSYLTFDKDAYAWQAGVDYRENPELYRVGRGEQGVLICEPYKSEIVVHWKFATPELAQKSSKIIFNMFKAYLKNDEFVGADMARKFLQMGFTRARRYANYKGGKKYDQENDYSVKERGTGDPQKAECAAIFFEVWKKAEVVPKYERLKMEWKAAHG